MQCEWVTAKTGSNQNLHAERQGVPLMRSSATAPVSISDICVDRHNAGHGILSGQFFAFTCAP